MSWWSRLTGGKSEGESRPGRVDYLSEALALERQGDYDAALTSYRLALRDGPNDLRVLQNMAIALTRTGQIEEAVRCYRRALELDPALGGAHYGLAFLLLKRGDRVGATEHLEAFLERSANGPESERWVRHARQTLDALRGEPTDDATPPHGAPRASRRDDRRDEPHGDPARGDTGRGPPSAGGAGARF
jgi:tetratricopeptide (TPR) repeat protein